MCAQRSRWQPAAGGDPPHRTPLLREALTRSERRTPVAAGSLNQRVRTDSRLPRAGRGPPCPPWSEVDASGVRPDAPTAIRRPRSSRARPPPTPQRPAGSTRWWRPQPWRSQPPCTPISAYAPVPSVDGLRRCAIVRVLSVIGHARPVEPDPPPENATRRLHGRCSNRLPGAEAGISTREPRTDQHRSGVPAANIASCAMSISSRGGPPNRGRRPSGFRWCWI